MLIGLFLTEQNVDRNKDRTIPFPELRIHPNTKPRRILDDDLDDDDVFADEEDEELDDDFDDDLDDELDDDDDLDFDDEDDDDD